MVVSLMIAQNMYRKASSVWIYCTVLPRIELHLHEAPMLSIQDNLNQDKVERVSIKKLIAF